MLTRAQEAKQSLVVVAVPEAAPPPAALNRWATALSRGVAALGGADRGTTTGTGGGEAVGSGHRDHARQVDRPEDDDVIMIG